MRALVLQRVGVIELSEVPEPEPGDGEVVVDVAAAGVCGSDVHSARDGGLLRKPPLVMGHEFAGTVRGRRVAVNPFVSCGACDLCRHAHDQLCRRREIIGIQRAGAFAERVAVPARCLVDLPDSVSIEAGALAEPLAVALHAVRLGPIGESTRLGIVGAGTIGLMAAWLCAGKVGELMVADRDTARRHRVEQLGAVGVPELSGEFDVVIDAVGTRATHAASLHHLRPEGTAVWVGNESPEPEFDAQELVRTGRRVLGSAAYRSDEFTQAARQVDDRLLSWVSMRSLDDASAVFRALTTGPPERGAVKVLLQP